MKLSKIMLIALALCTTSVLLPSCAADSTQTVEGQVVTVRRGDLRIDITAAGNLALSHKEDLAFEMDGTVEEVLVAEAESVEEGQLLAKLDTSAWQDYVTGLQDEVTTAERNVTAKERAVTQAERNVTTKKRALLQAQIDLNNAKLSLEKTEQESTDILEIEIKELGVELAEGKLGDAQIAVGDATEGVGDAQIAVEDAKQTLEDAKQALAEAMDDSPEIKAPFNGFITKVNVKGGDEVKKGTVAVQIADPNKFEADILVNEMNFLHVKLGGVASVQVDAMPGLILPAKVSHISPAAVIQSGVVNYQVKVEVQSLEEAMREQQEAMQETMQERQQASGNLTSDNISSGGPSRRSRRSSVGDNLTQEQLDQMRQQRQQARAGQTEGQQRQMQTMVPEDFKLTEGMTITLSIITQERNDVLLVPVQAIMSQGRETLVQVMKDGVVEERSITAGLSNWQYAEITSGLSEGEQVVVPETTTTTPATQQQQRGSQQGIPRDIRRMLR
ncbi:efflux RND transporter periplasmic adaptor subunit [Chloroflexota bacterium]